MGLLHCLEDFCEVYKLWGKREWRIKKGTIKKVCECLFPLTKSQLFSCANAVDFPFEPYAASRLVSPTEVANEDDTFLAASVCKTQFCYLNIVYWFLRQAVSSCAQAGLGLVSVLPWSSHSCCYK